MKMESLMETRILKVRKCSSCVHFSKLETEWDALGSEKLQVVEYIKVTGMQIPHTHL